MNRRIPIAALLAAAALSIPSVAATWYSSGDYEPDTEDDRLNGWMYLNPDTTEEGRQVYFNGYVANYPIGQWNNIGKNPVNGPGSRLYAGNVQFHAMLGLWKDCNKDGYIGLAESAVLDYLVALGEHDANVCPPTPRTFHDPADQPVHNDGTWVKEFITIGTADPCSFSRNDTHRRENCANIAGFSRNPDVLYANGTFVWTDDAAPGNPSRGVCPLRPVPRGTTAGTGGFLYFADCVAGRNIAKGVNTVEDATPGDTGLRFEDPNRPQQSTSRLNQEFPVNLWGNPYNNQKTGLLESYDPYSDTPRPYRPAFTVADCSSERTEVVRDPTAPGNGNGSLNQVGVKAPPGTPQSAKTSQDYLLLSANFTDNRGVILAMYAVDPKIDGRSPTNPSTNPASYTERSYWAALEEANDGVYFGPNYQARTAGDCNRQTNNTVHNNNNFGLIEDQHEPRGPTGKVAANQRFNFFNGLRGLPGGATVNENLSSYFYPNDLGVNRRSAVFGPMWNSQAVTVASQAIINRGTLQPEGAFYRTYYAMIGQADAESLRLEFPKSTVGIYGHEACNGVIGANAPDANGWVCDPAFWNRNPAGEYTGAKYSDGTRIDREVGDEYRLRDVDCWDGHIADGIYLSIHAQGQTGLCDR